jgi:hypothetical protein
LAIADVVAQIDAEIGKLQQVKALLRGDTVAAVGRGRPKGSRNAAAKAPAKKSKRRLSPEGRRKIAEAMKRRWAERKKQAAK